MEIKFSLSLSPNKTVKIVVVMHPDGLKTKKI